MSLSCLRISMFAIASPLTFLSDHKQQVSSWLLMALVWSIPLSISLSTIFFISAVISLLVEYRHELDKLKKNVLFFPVILYALIMIIGLIQAPNIPNEYLSHFQLKMFFKKMTLCSILLFYHAFLQQPKRCQQCLNALFFACVIIVIAAGIYQMGLPWHWLKFKSELTFVNHDSPYFFVNQIFMGIFMAFASFAALLKAMDSQTGQVESRRYAILWAIFSFSSFFQSPSRTGYIIYALITPVLFIANFRHLTWQKQTKYLSLLTGVIAIICLLNAPMFRQRVSDMVNDLSIYQSGNYHHFFSKTSPGIRLQKIKNAWHVFQMAPFFGQAFLSFGLYFSSFEPITAFRMNFENTFLTLLAEHGIVGLLSFLWLYAALCRQHRINHLAMTLLCVYFLSSLSQDCWSTSVLRYFFLVMIPLVFAQLPLRQTKS